MATSVGSLMASTKPSPKRLSEERKVRTGSPEPLEYAAPPPPPLPGGESSVGVLPSAGAMAQTFVLPSRLLAKAMAELSAAQVGKRSEAALLVRRVATPPTAGVL